jgi:hypothetical protein
MGFNTALEKLRFILSDDVNKIYYYYIHNLTSVYVMKLYDIIRKSYKRRCRFNCVTDKLRRYYDIKFIKQIDSGKYDDDGYLIPSVMKQIRGDIPLIIFGTEN